MCPPTHLPGLHVSSSGLYYYSTICTVFHGSLASCLLSVHAPGACLSMNVNLTLPREAGTKKKNIFIPCLHETSPQVYKIRNADHHRAAAFHSANFFVLDSILSLSCWASSCRGFDGRNFCSSPAAMRTWSMRVYGSHVAEACDVTPLNKV